MADFRPDGRGDDPAWRVTRWCAPSTSTTSATCSGASCSSGWTRSPGSPPAATTRGAASSPSPWTRWSSAAGCARGPCCASTPARVPTARPRWSTPSRSSPTTSRPAPRRRSSPPTSASSASTAAGNKTPLPQRLTRPPGHPAAAHGHHRPRPHRDPSPRRPAWRRAPGSTRPPRVRHPAPRWPLAPGPVPARDRRPGRGTGRCHPGPQALALDCAGLTDWDSGLVAYLLGVRELATRRA